MLAMNKGLDTLYHGASQCPSGLVISASEKYQWALNEHWDVIIGEPGLGGADSFLVEALWT
jgi:hypothetical protein